MMLNAQMLLIFPFDTYIFDRKYQKYILGPTLLDIHALPLTISIGIKKEALSVLQRITLIFLKFAKGLRL